MTDKEMTPDTLPENQPLFTQDVQEVTPEIAGRIGKFTDDVQFQIFNYIFDTSQLPQVDKERINHMTPEEKGAFMDAFREWATQLPERLQKMQEGVERLTKSLTELSANTGIQKEYDNSIKSINEWISLLQDTIREEFDQPKENLPTVTVKRADMVEYPLDKVNGVIWDLLEEDTGGQLKIGVEKRGSPKEVNIIYSIDFDGLPDNLKISKQLDPFDKRVYIAISALFNAGNDNVTLTQIHYTMGNKTRPSLKQLERVDAALTKMSSAIITIDNAQEVKAKYKYPKFVYSGSLLPSERVKRIVNGQITEAAIHLFREPPVMTFAKQRQQVTTFSAKLLQSPISKTIDNLRLEDYLLERITKAAGGKTRKTQERILYKTLYKKAGITTAKQRQRATVKIRGYLDYYISQNLIQKYSIDNDGLTVSL